MEIDCLRALWKRCFDEEDPFLDLFFGTAYAPERCRFLTVEGSLGAALYWLDATCDGRKLAYLYAVGTEPSLRGQGLCRKLLERTHDDLKSLGYAGALLVPGSASLREMYRKLGYTTCSSIDELSCQAGTAIPLRPIGAAEYAALRRRFLPQGGVIQEGESLRLLAGFASFYAGEDFLLAAGQTGACLTGLELLGNPSAAPGILASLGCREGTFRAPGKSVPFAMFHPLGPDVRCPSYFGLDFG